MISKEGYVFLPFIESRHMNQYHAEAVVEVFPESVVVNLLPDIFVGCGYYPDVNVDILVRSHPGYLVFLQCPENLCLCCQAHVSHLVEKDSASRSLFKLADTLFDCRGE